MDLQLAKKSVVVLASSKGLGKASALAFAREGANVTLASRNSGSLKQAADEIYKETGVKPSFKECDVTNPEDIKALFAQAASEYGTVDVLVNNAGGPKAGGFDSQNDEDWQTAFELNLLSFVRAVREALPYMKKNGGGRIVNIASSSIKEPVEGLLLSNTFRMGIVGLSKTLAKEYGAHNILVNTVGPGRIATDRVAELDQIRADRLGMSYDEAKKQHEKTIPVGRYGEPGEFAKAIVFLGSFANTYVTGQSIVVDGGSTKAY
ncbi:SDR family oxidoreductase [Alteribacter keqinensis]|uniref:SDR family oxidoreductase n=1 Tax=Alteribacter keqinensis TaxID=2483800 RepID=A0A3M7TPR5_9BACI|nr:SDR family oxidoreductase [Alteribacter keqinensis]RNA67624.1 SDR family oxidoreductase [Alteribacter keqinensis]